MNERRLDYWTSRGRC